jgi:hypothetical protein
MSIQSGRSSIVLFVIKLKTNNISLSELFQKISPYRNCSKKYHPTGTVPKNIILSELFQIISPYQNCSKKYHPIRTVPKNITLSELF